MREEKEIESLFSADKGAVAHGDYFFLNQHNFLITIGMTLFFIYLRTELNYLSNDIILYGFMVVVYTLYRWTIGGRPKFDLLTMPNSE